MFFSPDSALASWRSTSSIFVSIILSCTLLCLLVEWSRQGTVTSNLPTCATSFTVIESEKKISPGSLLLSTWSKSSKLWSSQLWTHFKQLRIEAWKRQDFMGFEPVTSRYRCDAFTNWAMKPLTLRTGLFQASIRNCLNCVHNCDDHSLLDFKSAVQSMKHFIYHFTWSKSL